MDAALGSLLEGYTNQPVLRGLIQLVPLGIGSAIDSFLATKVVQYQHDRLRTFFDELAEGCVELSDAVAGSEDFIHAFTATTAAAIRTRQKEKIRFFARLLKSTFTQSGPKSFDEYEEILSLVDDLSYRELQILTILARCEREITPRPDQNELQRANDVWPAFETAVKGSLGIEPELLGSMLARLQRSGCYVEISGGYFDYTGGRGHLSALYRRVEALVGISDDRVVHATEGTVTA